MALQCRLLHDITKVDHALNFWAARLKAGQHRSFLLLGQGPTSFVLDILAVISRKTERHNHLSATDQIERRVSIFMFPASSRCRHHSSVSWPDTDSGSSWHTGL
jgi:hypothetical protein